MEFLRILSITHGSVRNLTKPHIIDHCPFFKHGYNEVKAKKTESLKKRENEKYMLG